MTDPALYARFVRHMAPFLLTPAAPLAVSRRPHRLPLDCTDPKFAEVLSGRPRRGRRPIVDFVPLGYEVDTLEVRLLELYDVVDAFVVYEAPVTQQGTRKPLYFNRSLSTGRWDAFLPKILHVIGGGSELAAAVRLTTSTCSHSGLARCKSDPRAWSVEESMRRIPVGELNRSSTPLARRLRSSAEALALQNDVDEIPSAATLHHLANCEARLNPPYCADPCCASIAHRSTYACVACQHRAM